MCVGGGVSFSISHRFCIDLTIVIAILLIIRISRVNIIIMDFTPSLWTSHRSRCVVRTISHGLHIELMDTASNLGCCSQRSRSDLTLISQIKPARYFFFSGASHAIVTDFLTQLMYTEPGRVWDRYNQSYLPLTRY